MPTADASIFKSFPSNNIGAGTSLVAGANSAGNPARALIRYDFTGQLPPGAIVDAVGLELTVVNSPGSGGVASTFALHRMLVPWIEGTKTGHNGAIATAGEPTWLTREFPSTPWSTSGGASGVDFSVTPSATTSVDTGLNPSFVSTPGLVADVQAWLTDPTSNRGWILLSQSETTPATARRCKTTASPGAPPRARHHRPPETVSPVRPSPERARFCSAAENRGWVR